MSLKYCLKDAILQSVGKPFSDVLDIILGKESRFQLYVHIRLHSSLTFIHFPLDIWTLPESGKEGEGRRREIQENDSFSRLKKKKTKHLPFALSLEMYSISENEHSKLISWIPYLQSQVLLQQQNISQLLNSLSRATGFSAFDSFFVKAMKSRSSRVLEWVLKR